MMNKLQEKLNFLLDKYSVDAKATIISRDVAVINANETPLLSYRCERRFIELKNIVQGGTLAGVSVMRVSRIVEKGMDLFEILKREFDICQFILGKQIISVMAMCNDNTLNVIAKTENDIICTIEIASTLKEGVAPIDKHEIIAQRGTACDVVVDAQLRQNSVYVFGEEKKEYTDVDFELYGLCVEDIAVVRAAFDIAQNNRTKEYAEIDSQLDKLITLAKKSANSCEREVM